MTPWELRGTLDGGRLRARRRAHPRELVYFSFYVIKDSIHEREIETLLIRAAGPSLEFNTRKKRVGIKPGGVKDFEAGTLFFERRTRRNVKRARKSAGNESVLQSRR